MSDVITNYFLNAQLSQAAYADLTGGLSVDVLEVTNQGVRVLENVQRY